MLVSPGADCQRMLKYRYVDLSGKLGVWYLSGCKISRLPPSFGALVCSGNLNLSCNKLESLPESFSEISVGRNLNLSYNKLKSLPKGFSEISVAGDLYLYGNLQLTGVPENFPNVKGRVHR